MGKPLKVGSKHGRYMRVGDKRVYDENFDGIFGKKPRGRGGRIRVKFKDGQKIVEELDKS